MGRMPAMLLAVAALTGAARGPFWATVPTGFADAVYVNGLSSPVAMAFAPDGRLFVCEKGGALRVVSAAGSLLPAPFVSLTVETGGERGLLGVAFDPQFASNGYVYVYHTVPGTSVRNRVSRFTASGDTAVAGSELVLLELEALPSMYHNGGALHFGPDGCLYVAVGDAGPSWHAQNLWTRFGKILRINRDGTIPSDNPSSFPGITGSTINEFRAIWAVGLRNPFTFAFQPGTGRCFVNDVGQAAWEEINEVAGGQNLGWPTTEGDFDPATYPNFTRPRVAYGRDGAGLDPALGECIAGAVFYPSSGAFPAAWRGRYFYADLTNRWIRGLDPTTFASELFAQDLNNPVDLDAGPDGALYYLEFGGGFAGGGRVGRIAYTAAGTPPSITADPSDRSVAAGAQTTFSVSATGTAPLSYEWRRDGVPVAGAAQADHTHTAALGDDGTRWRCVVSNAWGSATSAEAVLTVTADQPPQAQIASPGAGSTYRAGDTVAFAGTATDPEDGALGGTAFTWRVDFHHGTHFHPFLPDTTGATSGQFVVPATGETASDVWYRITLVVRDSAGSTAVAVRDVVPVTAQVTLATDPPGLQVLLDGQPRTAPHVFTGVAGIERALEAADQGGHVFSHWSDGGARARTYVTPDADATLTAVFAPPAGGGGGSSSGSCGLLGVELLLLGLLGARIRR